MHLSLALLKVELPSYFRNLDPHHEALRWAPKSGATENRTHPYLRSHLLAGDYSVYDAERARLRHRAKKAGLSIEEINDAAPPKPPQHDGLRV